MTSDVVGNYSVVKPSFNDLCKEKKTKQPQDTNNYNSPAELNVSASLCRIINMQSLTLYGCFHIH